MNLVYETGQTNDSASVEKISEVRCQVTKRNEPMLGRGSRRVAQYQVEVGVDMQRRSS